MRRRWGRGDRQSGPVPGPRCMCPPDSGERGGRPWRNARCAVTTTTWRSR
jgi:hypothetical protein